MAKAYFNSKFNCASGPKHSEAECPSFDEHAINERSSRFVAGYSRFH